MSCVPIQILESTPRSSIRIQRPHRATPHFAPVRKAAAPRSLRPPQLCARAHGGAGAALVRTEDTEAEFKVPESHPKFWIRIQGSELESES